LERAAENSGTELFDIALDHPIDSGVVSYSLVFLEPRLPLAPLAAFLRVSDFRCCRITTSS
jgi:hypothetical protein